MKEFGYFIVIVLVLYFLVIPFIRGLRGEGDGKQPKRVRPAPRRDTVQDLMDSGQILFPARVAGESFHQNNIRRVAAVGKRVILVPEPDNPHDKNAVRVDVDGLPIGHIPRDMAEEAKRKKWEAIVAAVYADKPTIGVVLGITQSDGQEAPNRPK